MSVVAVASAKASPGVTTLAAALCHVWPESRPVILAELDASGGDLGARWGLSQPGDIPRPGLFTLAVDAGQSRPSAADLEAHTSRRGGVLVLAAPAEPDQCQTALATALPWLVDALGDWPGDAVIDCGRVNTSSPQFELATRADATIVVSRPTKDELPRAASLVRTLEERGPQAFLALVGEGLPLVGSRYTSREAAALGVEVLSVLADDPEGASRLSGDTRPRDIDRTDLIRSTRAMASRLLESMAARHPAGAEEVAIA